MQNSWLILQGFFFFLKTRRRFLLKCAPESGLVETKPWARTKLDKPDGHWPARPLYLV
jgi:hypothetical protein